MWPSPVKQAGGRVQADPAGARDVGLGPRVQVGEVLGCAGQLRAAARRPRRAARGSPRRIARRCRAVRRAARAARRVAAGADAALERLLGRLNAGLHAHRVADVGEHAPVAIRLSKSIVRRLVRGMALTHASNRSPAGSVARYGARYGARSCLSAASYANGRLRGLVHEESARWRGECPEPSPLCVGRRPPGGC